MVDTNLLASIHALPKIELHRHLEGSLRLDTMIDIAQEHGMEMPEYDSETLRPFVQMMPGEPRNMQHFMGKFLTLRQYYRSLAVVERITREAIIDAALDNIKYLELRFTPPALCNLTQASYEEVIALVCETAAKTSAEYDIDTRLIVSMNRHEAVEIGERVLEAALPFRNQGVVAVDLAGREPGFSANPFRDIFVRAKAQGLGVTIHAGEWDGPQSVWDAVGNLAADRVGHGIRSVEDLGIIHVLMERGTVLEVCPSSNVDSGVVNDMKAHPLQQLARMDVITTINTDDPLISNITLSEEIHRVMTHMGLTLDEVKSQILNAARAAFLPEAERDQLVVKFTHLLGVNSHEPLSETSESQPTESD